VSFPSDAYDRWKTTPEDEDEVVPLEDREGYDPDAEYDAKKNGDYDDVNDGLDE
jgi:hypothetical protein